MTIEQFQGKYRFLSNFWPAEVELDGVVYPTVEHAYQAAKTLNPEHRELIRLAEKPADAKYLGKRLKQRSAWANTKLVVMLDLLQQKFKHPHLAQQLLETGDEELVEGNSWGDRYWGVSRGKGENLLGKLLMHVRKELQDAQRSETQEN